VNAYITSRYVLAIPEGVCDARVTGGRHLGTGFRFFVDHACPAPIGTTLAVHSEILRDISPDYRFGVIARFGTRDRRWLLGPGETDATLELTPPPAPLPGDVSEEPPPQEGARLEGLSRLFAFLDEGGGVGAAALALGIAAALGALHGLTPGHGKTLVAAYLAGTEAKLRHAFAVGLTLTVTHTAAVLAFGVLALAAGTKFVPQRVEPIMQAVAAGLVIALGLFMLVRRIGTLRQGRHAHSHEHVPAQAAALSGRGIVAVGMAGGIVPCPEAFGLLFVALTLGRVMAGLLILLAFSAGLAAVLVAVSIALVLSRKAMAPRLERSRVVRFLPVVSASLVTMIGVALAVGAAQRL
jgi:ABC-type nickel/cobalt efflux system permease component RcnA